MTQLTLTVFFFAHYSELKLLILAITFSYVSSMVTHHRHKLRMAINCSGPLPSQKHWSDCEHEESRFETEFLVDDKSRRGDRPRRRISLAQAPRSKVPTHPRRLPVNPGERASARYSVLVPEILCMVDEGDRKARRTTQSGRRFEVTAVATARAACSPLHLVISRTAAEPDVTSA